MITFTMKKLLLISTSHDVRLQYKIFLTCPTGNLTDTSNILGWEGTGKLFGSLTLILFWISFCLVYGHNLHTS